MQLYLQLSKDLSMTPGFSHSPESTSTWPLEDRAPVQLCGGGGWGCGGGLFLRQSQVDPGERGLLGPGKQMPVPTLHLPTQSELQHIRLSFERKKMAITEVPVWPVVGGSSCYTLLLE